jgi:SAM-dependent methyltransferase
MMSPHLPAVSAGQSFGTALNGGATEQLWSSGGAYESFMGRWSRLVAPTFVEWLSRVPGERWLDVGSGTGELTQAILDLATPIEVCSVEPSDGLMSWAESIIPDLRVRFTSGEAEHLPCEAGHFDVVVSGLVLDVIGELDLALAEMVRVVRTGGAVGAYVWDYAGGMTVLRAFWDAAAELDPQAHTIAENPRTWLCRLDRLFALFDRAGLTHCSLRSIDVSAQFEDFDDFWGPFLTGQGTAPHYAMSLAPERREALRARLESTLPAAGDGSITMPLRAWAIQGHA